jgi:hypothetical protein
MNDDERVEHSHQADVQRGRGQGTHHDQEDDGDKFVDVQDQLPPLG